MAVALSVEMTLSIHGLHFVTRKESIRVWRRYMSRTRTAVSRVRVDHGELIGLNTVGIEDGASVSAKLA